MPFPLVDNTNKRMNIFYFNKYTFIYMPSNLIFKERMTMHLINYFSSYKMKCQFTQCIITRTLFFKILGLPSLQIRNKMLFHKSPEIAIVVW
jgi:hypothetical protein